ncbi:Ankyrin repeat protein 1 [Giardia muris]|uniref:Ankyrin repeat protein 1 n=1 Tax=Giardia muris TaxID=5742 RepID=A0A4Z1T3Y3_GIAMU|nr:Ankyrin repeat protein 1 [Giardia muris]|eukprot:TNJ27249.1 Ankyrin repeat protein 1 [Giardia muris]
MTLRRWFVAADNGDVTFIRSNMKQYARSQDAQFLSRTALMFAANRGHLEICQLLMEKESKMCNRRGNTALHFAAAAGHAEIVTLLAPLEAGVQNEAGETALIQAITNGRMEAMLVLLRYESEIKTGDGRTPLQVAEQTNQTALAAILRGDAPNPLEDAPAKVGSYLQSNMSLPFQTTALQPPVPSVRDYSMGLPGAIPTGEQNRPVVEEGGGGGSKGPATQNMISTPQVSMVSPFDTPLISSVPLTAQLSVDSYTFVEDERLGQSFQARESRHLQRSMEQLSRIMELEDRNATLTAMLETMMKPEQYPDQFEEDLHESRGVGASVLNEAPESVTQEDLRLLFAELKQARREIKTLYDFIRVFAAKFDSVFSLREPMPPEKGE